MGKIKRPPLLAHTLCKLREVRAYAADAARSLDPDARRIVIFAQGRTGSTLLENLIASTGHFEERGEILDPKQRGEAYWPLRFALGEAKRAGPANFIFHVKTYQLTRYRYRPVDVGAFLRALHGHGWAIVYLRRENQVRQVLSNFVAKNRGAYHKYDDRSERVQFRLDPEQFFGKLDDRLANTEAERTALAGLPHLSFVYERDLENPARHQAVVDEIMDYVGLERRPARTVHRKINTYRVEDLIENLGELTPMLQARNLAW